VDKWITLAMAEAKRIGGWLAGKNESDPGVQTKMALESFFLPALFASIIEGP
jgi:hypothetical protein